MSKKKEVTRITTGKVFGWIFGVIFALVAFGGLVSAEYIMGITFSIMALVLLPPMNKIYKKKFNFELSGGVKFLIIIGLFVVMIIVNNYSERFEAAMVEVQPTENIQQETTPSTEIVQPKSTEIVQPKVQKKVKSATLTVDRVTESATNINKIRITITNTGDVSITPNFDVIITDSSGKIFCDESPMFGIGSVSAGEKKTDEISIFCTLGKDGIYDVRVDLLDEGFNKLDSDSKSLTVEYWSKFGLA